MRSTTEALDLTLKSGSGSAHHTTPLVRQFSVPDVAKISLPQLDYQPEGTKISMEYRPMKVKERFALRYSMRSTSMDSEIHSPHTTAQRIKRSPSWHSAPGLNIEFCTPLPTGGTASSSCLISSTSDIEDTSGTTRSSYGAPIISDASPSSGSGLAGNSCATSYTYPSSHGYHRSPTITRSSSASSPTGARSHTVPFVRCTQSLPEFESPPGYLNVVQEEMEQERETQKGKRKILLFPSVSSDDSSLPSPTKKPSPGASPSQTW